MESSIAEQQRILASDWGGGKSPFGTSWSKFMMWIFIISDALTFAAFLIGYGFMRSISPEWPKQTEVFNMVLITFMTFILISSSAVMAMAVGAARARNPKLAFQFLVLTIVGGLIFLGCQAFEWSHLIEEGARLTHNPWGVPQFAAAFFVISGYPGRPACAVLACLCPACRASCCRVSRSYQVPHLLRSRVSASTEVEQF